MSDSAKPWRLCDRAWSEEPIVGDRASASRCWLLVPGLAARATLRGRKQLLPSWSATESREWTRFELPASNGVAEEEAEIDIDYDDGARVVAKYTRPVDLPREANRTPASLLVEEGEEQSSLTEEALASLGRHIELVNSAWDASSSARARGEELGSPVVVPFEVFAKEWQDAATTDDARQALIVRIATEMGDLITELCRRPRVVLRRQRSLVAMERIAQVDAACLRWVVRQPGRTLIEKAGPAQRLLGVTRHAHADTLENRVLRDFVVRAIRAGIAYRVENRGRASSKRVKLVGDFVRKLRRLLKEPSMAGIGVLVGVPEPNYALLFDPRYSVLWVWYQKLRRLQKEQDDLWRWRHRAWAEIVLCNVQMALDGCTRAVLGGQPLVRGQVLVRRDLVDGNESGRFLDHRSPWPLGILHEKRQCVVDVLCNPVADLGDARLAGLYKLCPDFILRIRESRAAAASTRFLGVWTEFTPVSDPEQVSADGLSLFHAIQGLQASDIAGLLVYPGGESGRSGDLDYVSTGAFPTMAMRLPPDQQRAAASIRDALDSALGVC